MSPDFVSKHFEKGSVVYIRKPFEVPAYNFMLDLELRVIPPRARVRTYSQMAVVLIESHKVHGHSETQLPLQQQEPFW